LTTEQEVLNAILLATQTGTELFVLINKLRMERNLPPLSPQDQHDANEKVIEQIEENAKT
jgi:hypothetical protein